MVAGASKRRHPDHGSPKPSTPDRDTRIPIRMTLSLAFPYAADQSARLTDARRARRRMNGRRTHVPRNNHAHRSSHGLRI